MRPSPLLLVAPLPALAAGLVGLAHPVFLTPDTAERWRLLHVLLLPLFPLVGAAPSVLLLGRRGALAWSARLLGAAFGLLYTTLDAVAGIGGGEQMARAAQRGAARPPVEDLFGIGDRFGRPGATALVAALLVTALVLRDRPAPAAAGGLVGAAAAVLVLRHHVFPPLGVLGMVGVAAAAALLAVAAAPRAAGPAPRTASGSAAGAPAAAG